MILSFFVNPIFDVCSQEISLQHQIIFQIKDFSLLHTALFPMMTFRFYEKFSDCSNVYHFLSLEVNLLNDNIDA